MKRFWDDLKDRQVIRVSVAYIVAAWLLLQVGELIFQALQLPDWALTLLFALLAIGFPIAVVLAWAFQITPDGVVLDLRGPGSGKHKLRRNLDVVIIGSLVIAVAILGYKNLADNTSVDTAALPAPESVANAQIDNSIAVLRFLNIGGESHFADGLSEELLDRLAQLRELNVSARTSSWAFSEKDVDIPTIASSLAVNYVLEGSVRQVGNRLRITAQLNKGETGMHVWSQTYDRELSTANFFETQSEIARKVVSLLQISLSPDSESRIATSPDTNMQALELYLKGQEFYRRPHSDESLNAAIGFYQQSLEADPRFALAYAGLCEAELGRYIIARDVAMFEEAERVCHRALTLDPELAHVQAALGTLYLFSGQDERAEQELRKALEDSPNLIDAYADLGEAVEFQGRVDEAEEIFAQMGTRQPGYWYSHNAMGMFLYRQSRYEEAAAAFRRVTELDPDIALGYNNLGNAFYMLNDYGGAVKAYRKSVEIEPYSHNYSNLGLAHFYAGEYEEAAEMQRKALDLQPDDGRILGRLASAYLYSGRAEEAEQYFRQAIDMLEESLVVNPNEVRDLRFLAVYNASIGIIEEARQAIDTALKLQPDSAGVRFDAAKVSLASGNREEALQNLELAKELGYSLGIIRADPFFEPLHDDAKFILIIQQQTERAET